MLSWSLVFVYWRLDCRKNCGILCFGTMDRSKKQMTDAEIDELTQREENELLRLKRQLRLMLNDKERYLKTYTMESSVRNKALHFLRKEESDLRLSIKMSQRRGVEDQRDIGRLVDLINQHEELNEEISEKKKHSKELDSKILEMQGKLSSCHGEALDEERKTREANMEKYIEKLENKLDNNVKQFCDIIAVNKMLREEIEALLKDRKTFNKIWENITSRLDDGKRIIVDLLEQANHAYDMQEEYQEKIKVLHVKAHSMQALHTEEMRVLVRNLDQQQNLGEFLETKGAKRQLLSMLEKEKKKKEKMKSEMEEELKNYQQTLDIIKNFVGEENVLKISEKYLKIEEENFALFTYINSLNSEVELLSANIDDLTKKIDEHREIQEERANQKKRTMEALEKELEDCTLEADKTQATYNTKALHLMQMIEEIAKIITMMECNSSPVLELLGDSTKINDYNIMLYLSVMESRLLEVMKQYYHKNK